MDIDISQAQFPSLLRRLAALIYDGVLLFGILSLATGLAIVVYTPLAGGDFPGQSWWFRTWLVSVIVAFFAYFWTHGGQTLGMRAWRLRLVRADGGEPLLRDALMRLICALVALAPVGLGLWWMLIDSEGLAWHDRWSRTRLVLVKR